jgi:hypothetical protein
MEERNVERQLASLKDLQAIAADKERMRKFVLKASMIDSLRKSNMMA